MLATDSPSDGLRTARLRPGEPGRRGSAIFWLLGGVVLLALVLRLWGIGWQLPHAIYYDERLYVLAEDKPWSYRNPSLLPHLFALEYRLLPLFGQAQPNLGSGADRNELALRILIARVTVVLLAAGNVGLLYVVGRKAFGPRTGLLAAALLAVNYLHVHLSHYGINDVPATFFLTAALLPSVGLLKHPNGRGFLLAGLLGGLAAATKYNYGIVLVVPLAAWVLHAARRSCGRETLLRGPALLGLGALSGLLVGMPEIVWSFSDVRDGVLRQATLGEARWPGQESVPALTLYARALLQAFGAPALLAALAGLAVLLRRRPALGLALAVCPLAYFLFMVGRPLFFARFALLLVPFGCLFAAYGLVFLWAKLPASRGRSLLVVAASLALLGLPGYLSAQLDLLAGQTDTRVEAEGWLRANVTPGTSIAVQQYSLPIIFPGGEIERTYQVTTFTPLSDERQFNLLACAGNRYVFISSYRWERQRTVGRGEPTGYEALATAGRLLITFGPSRSSASIPLNLDDLGLPFWDLGRYARPGPSINVYELPKGAC